MRHSTVFWSKVQFEPAKPLTAQKQAHVGRYAGEGDHNAAKIKPGQRFGLHSFRSTLATWLVSVDKSDPKTVQGSLRHANIETTLGDYAQVVTDEMIAAQGRWLQSCGLGVGQNLLAENAGAPQIQ